MKINSLLESTTLSASPEVIKDEAIVESTTSGSVSSVATPVGNMQRRGKGSMFAGIKTSSKYPNSKSVKEGQINEVDPRNFDSDEDYYAAKNAPAKPRYRGTQSPGVNPDDEAYFREIFRKKRLAAQQAEREADHARIATGTNEGEEMGTFAALKDWRVWDVRVFNNFYAGKYADYGPRLYSVVASSPEEARQVVINNPDYVLQDLLARKLQNGKRVLPRGSALPVEEKRVGKADPGTITTMGFKKMLTPDGVQSFKFTNGKIVDGAHVKGGEEQGVAEEKQRLDPKCWTGYKKQGTKMKGGVRVNNCVKVDEAEFTEDKLAQDLYKDLQIFKKGADKGIGSKAKDKEIGNKPKDKDIVVKEEFNGEYDDEAGSAESNLLTAARAVKGLLDTIEDRDNLPEWVQEKIAKAESMLVASWDYLLSQKEQGLDPQIAEDWQKANKSDKTDGMSTKAVKAYRRENPGSKLQTAVTKKPSELKAGSKDAKRRKSFCARMSGNKGPMKDENGKPTPKAKALKRWNC